MPSYSPLQTVRSPSPLLPWHTPPMSAIRLPPFATIRDFSDAGEREREFPARHTRPNLAPPQRSDGYIDLTADSSPSNPSFIQPPHSPLLPTLATGSRTMPPRRVSDDAQQPSRKRRRVDSATDAHVSEDQSVAPTTHASADVIEVGSFSPEEVDLTGVEDLDGLKKLQDEQRARHKISTQDRQNRLLQDSLEAQAPTNKGPVKLGQLTCIICMENMTDMTATHCGECSILFLSLRHANGSQVTSFATLASWKHSLRGRIKETQEACQSVLCVVRKLAEINQRREPPSSSHCLLRS